MKCWISALLLCLFLPTVLIITGILYKKIPPKKINWRWGFYSVTSVKNQEMWNFAQQYFGKVCRRCGLESSIQVIGVLLCVLGGEEKMLEIVSWIIVMAEIFLIAYMPTATERTLKKKFNL